MFRILLADDNRVLRDGLSDLLAMTREMKVVASVSDGAEAVAMTAALKPDVLVLDPRLRLVDGFQVIQKVRSLAPDVRVLVLSGDDRAATIHYAKDRGAHGFVPKGVVAPYLVEAIRALCDGRTYFPSMQNAIPA